jgi:O-antigen ligase/tetratricopeptide (TPR) repeat protein
MAAAAFPNAESPSANQAGGLLGALMEIVLWVMVVAAPWLYGAVHPGFELLLDVGLAVLLGLWALRMILECRVVLAPCAVTLALALLLLAGLWQLTPLPRFGLELASPATAELYDRLLPAEHEQVAGSAAAGAKPPGSTLSLCPSATRTECFRLLAVLLVFVCVRNTIATPATFRRLAVVLVINGCALCLFGLVQYFTSPRQELYWHVESMGQVFGPFVSRNLFPFYVNVCLGMALGLLLARRQAPVDEFGARRWSWWQRQADALTHVLGDWLQDPTSLWLVAAIVLMAGTVAFTLSRGGLLALVAGVVVFFLAARGGSRIGVAQLGVPLLMTGITLFFLSWLGLPLIESRLQTLWKPETADTTRLPCWLRVLPGVAEFPIFGTGLGSFRYVEVWRRQEEPLDPAAAGGRPVPLEHGLFDHAHNDYLEMLVEGGVVGLVLLLAVLVLVFRAGWRALGYQPDGFRAPLAAGGLCGLAAVAVHSFVDFGMHAPAIALLTVVLCAHLTALGTESEAQGAWRVRWLGLAPLAGTAALAGLALALCANGWKAHRVERFQAAAARVPEGSAERSRLQLPYLEAAARLAPDDPAVQMELMRLRLNALQEDLAAAEARNRLGVVGDQFLAGPSLVGMMATGFPVMVMSAGWDAHYLARGEMLAGEREQLSRAALPPALEACLRARDACPLLPEPHVTLALYAAALDKADTPRAYLDRVEFLTPRLPEVWYYSGLERLALGHEDEAWADWRRCLDLSDLYLDTVLARAARTLKADELLAKVLPDQPEVILRAANKLFPREEMVAGRTLYRKAALAAYARQRQPLPLAQLHTKARLEFSLGLFSEAELSYRGLLGRDPGNLEAHLELARLYYDRGDYNEALREVRAVLARQPNHAVARDLQARLTQARGNGS